MGSLDKIVGPDLIVLLQKVTLTVEIVITFHPGGSAPWTSKIN